MSSAKELWLPLLFYTAAWVGHACLWTTLLNNFYGRPLPKAFLKPWRLFTGIVIVGGPAIWWAVSATNDRSLDTPNCLFTLYILGCAILGGVVFPVMTVGRLATRWFRFMLVPAVLSETSRTVDFWPAHRHALIGDGKWRWLPRLPFNDVFRVEFTELTLRLPTLPPELDGLTIHMLSDLHFHGTPSRLFFDKVFDEIEKWPTPDVVALVGDYLDSDRHIEWFEPLFGRLKWKRAGLAILGNHDAHHRPQAVRDELRRLGFRILSGGLAGDVERDRGVKVCGHEGPWLPSPPDLIGTESADFTLCLSHTPDQFYWGQKNRIDLMLCGHVHGGQIRLPLIGSIFVPSIYGRRFDMGVFEENGTLMVVGRGLSGKEPIRFRCRPQVLRLTLVRNAPPRPASGG